MFCVLYVSFVGTKLLPQLSLDFSYHIRYTVLYENEPNFNIFGFYQLIIVECDKVNECKTNYSRNAHDETIIRNCNRIEKKHLWILKFSIILLVDGEY